MKEIYEKDYDMIDVIKSYEEGIENAIALQKSCRKIARYHKIATGIFSVVALLNLATSISYYYFGYYFIGFIWSMSFFIWCLSAKMNFDGIEYWKSSEKRWAESQREYEETIKTYLEITSQ